jgi:hypothetical protein
LLRVWHDTIQNAGRTIYIHIWRWHNGGACFCYFIFAIELTLPPIVIRSIAVQLFEQQFKPDKLSFESKIFIKLITTILLGTECNNRWLRMCWFFKQIYANDWSK